jgi:hypothetical protein
MIQKRMLNLVDKIGGTGKRLRAKPFLLQNAAEKLHHRLSAWLARHAAQKPFVT